MFLGQNHLLSMDALCPTTNHHQLMLQPHLVYLNYSIVICNVFIGVTNSKQFVAGESVNLTSFRPEDTSTSSMHYLWSGPAMNDCGNNRNISHLSDAGEYMCTATMPNSFVTSVIRVKVRSN